MSKVSASPPNWARCITVLYDAACTKCSSALETVKLRERTLSRPTIRLHAWPSEEASSLLANVATTLEYMNLGRSFSMVGEIVAILPTGLVLPGCQNDVMQLVYEMEYMTMIEPPSPSTTMRLERQTYTTLRQLRKQGADGQWWQSCEALHLIAAGLRDDNFCIVDGFCTPVLVAQLSESIKRTCPGGTIGTEGLNGWSRGGTARAAEAMEEVGQNARERSRNVARTLLHSSRGDVIRFSQDDTGMAGTCKLYETLDRLVRGLQSMPQVSARLRHTSFSNDAMFSVYPGGSARYVRHCDNSLMTDGRRLTCILYLNEDWQPSHGGCLRIFEPTMQSMTYKIDVEPIWNRLVIFWSNEDAPHEVLASYKHRAAVSVWYVCAEESLRTCDAFERLLSKLRAVGGRTPCYL
eukprot:TRINITY_DN34183_c0_g1_i4.p1 TRINITY_DN34183_c0_g1~~TRINITY_DN34183_c0_g1_i4.p1  ORF type:complete len:424 (-),score=42.86 TRINITY_DN34183_c0_g1_i4:52-1275(-)